MRAEPGLYIYMGTCETFESQLAAKVLCSQDLIGDSYRAMCDPIHSCIDQVPRDGTRKLNSIGGLCKPTWPSCFSISSQNQSGN